MKKTMPKQRFDFDSFLKIALGLLVLSLPSCLEAQVAEAPASSREADTQEAESRASEGVLQSAGEMLEQAKQGAQTTAKVAQQWTQKGIDGIGNAAVATKEVAGEMVSDTAQWANQTFESLKASGLTTANNTSEWLSQDWKNMQAWEYKTVALKADDQPAAESLDVQLNALGADGWECFHVEAGMFYFKKPSASYIRHLPFKDFIKLIPLLKHAK